jgi:hypothetical protein
MPVTTAQAGVLAGFDSTTRDAMLTDLGVADTATSGTISLTTRITNLSVTGTVAFTLPNGTIAGQRKRVLCTVAASIPAGTLTVTTPEDTAGIVCPSTFIFDTVGQAIDFVWSGTKWRVEKTTRAGVKTAVVGTTVLTGFNLCQHLALSVTGTVASATTMGIPNGAFPGDILIVGQSVAASIPVGSITGTYVTLANVAATDLQAWGALTDTVSLVWRGAAWLIIANSGVTVA